jgi:hypothetical protein
MMRSDTYHIDLATRMLAGTWGDDVLASMRSYLGPERAAWQGAPDLSRCPLVSWVQRVGTAYDGRAPLVAGLELALAEGLGDYPSPATLLDYASAGGRPLPTSQVRTSREALYLRLAAGCAGVLLTPLAPGRELPPAASPRVSLQAVPPTALQLTYGPHSDEEPIVVRRACRWQVGDRAEAAVEVSDLTDWRMPRWYVQLQGEGGRVVEELSGEAYPYRLADGTPYHRCVVIGHPDHAGETRALVAASLRVAQAWTLWMSGMTDAAFPARWIVGGRVGGVSSPSGVDVPASASGATVATGPQVVHLIDSIGETEARVGQWGPGFDPAAMAQAAREYEAGAVSALGVPVSLERTGGEPTATEAAALRALQERIYPELRQLDSEVLRRAASMLAGMGVEGLSEAPRPIAYHHDLPALLEAARAAAAPAPSPPPMAPATAPETPTNG